MPSFKLICEDEASPFKEKTISTIEFSAVTVSEVLENVQRFLAGAGYSIDGNIEVVKQESFNKFNEFDSSFGSMIEPQPAFFTSSFGNDTITLSSIEERNPK